MHPENLQIVIRDAQDWLEGIASAAEEGEIKPGDVAYIYREIEAIERRLQAITTGIIQDR